LLLQLQLQSDKSCSLTDNLNCLENVNAVLRQLTIKESAALRHSLELQQKQWQRVPSKSGGSLKLHASRASNADERLSRPRDLCAAPSTNNNYTSLPESQVSRGRRYRHISPWLPLVKREKIYQFQVRVRGMVRIITRAHTYAKTTRQNMYTSRVNTHHHHHHHHTTFVVRLLQTNVRTLVQNNKS